MSNSWPFLLLALGCVFMSGVMTGKKLSSDCDIESVQKKYDSLTVYQATLKIPRSRDSIIEVVIEVPADVDTAFIVSDYFKRRKFVSEYRDTNISIEVSPVISMNTLDSLSLKYRWIRPTTITTVISKPRNEFYGGLSLGINQVAPTLYWKTDDKWLLGAAYNVVDPAVSLHFAYKIF